MFKRFLSSLLLIIIGLTLGWEGAIYYESQARPPSTKTDTVSLTPTPLTKDQKDLKMFWQIWDIVQGEYVDPTVIDDQKRFYGAIKGMVASLKDPYTVFMDPQETKQFNDSLEGNLEGIGAELSIENGALMVVSPIKGSPAEKAGLKSKDIIYKVDDQMTGDMTLFEAISKIRGQKGTSVHLTILRKELERPLELTIVRDKINIPSVTFEMKNDNIAYVAINQFSDKTTSEFTKIMQQLLLKNPKGLILDLRNNGGGYLDSSVDILSEFLPGDKKAVVIKKRKKEDNQILYTSGEAHLENIPLVVLVNEGSASASEILAGALQDHKRAILIGNQTFGKGSVQQLEELEDGSSLRITIAKWHTPSERNIDKLGITPDRIVKITEEDEANKRDPQLEEAINYLQKKE